MASTPPIHEEPKNLPKRHFQPIAGALSYLVPGLGQIMQGRLAKGLLFFVCIYALFFYGIYLSSGSVTIEERTYSDASVVYLPNIDPRDTDRPGEPQNKRHPLLLALYNRPQFAGQFWVGVAAWPAIWQYVNYDQNKRHPWLGEFQREPSQATVNAVHNAGDKRLELAWVFTVIAGVLNILVIYDAVAGPAFILAKSNEQKAA